MEIGIMHQLAAENKSMYGKNIVCWLNDVGRIFGINNILQLNDHWNQKQNPSGN